MAKLSFGWRKTTVEWTNLRWWWWKSSRTTKPPQFGAEVQRFGNVLYPTFTCKASRFVAEVSGSGMSDRGSIPVSIRGFFCRGLRRSEQEADNLKAGVTNAWSFNSISLIRLHGFIVGHRNKFSIYIHMKSRSNLRIFELKYLYSWLNMKTSDRCRIFWSRSARVQSSYRVDLGQSTHR
jgi:hypothetical protein